MSAEVRFINVKPGVTKKRVGLIAPNDGRINEEEFPLAFPDEIGLLIAGLEVQKTQDREKKGLQLDNLERALAPPLIEDAARALVSAGADAIILNGMPLICMKEDGIADVLIDRIRKAAYLPTDTMATAVVESLKRLGVKKPLVVTPYISDLNKSLRRFLEWYGFQVPVIEGLGLSSRGLSRAEKPTEATGAQPVEVAYELAKKTFAQAPDADGVFIAGGGFRTLIKINDLERDLGVPVTSSALSTIWRSLCLVGHNKPIMGFGQLLSEKLP